MFGGTPQRLGDSLGIDHNHGTILPSYHAGCFQIDEVRKRIPTLNPPDDAQGVIPGKIRLNASGNLDGFAKGWLSIKRMTPDGKLNVSVLQHDGCLLVLHGGGNIRSSVFICASGRLSAAPRNAGKERSGTSARCLSGAPCWPSRVAFFASSSGVRACRQALQPQCRGRRAWRCRERRVRAPQGERWLRNVVHRMYHDVAEVRCQPTPRP